MRERIRNAPSIATVKDIIGGLTGETRCGTGELANAYFKGYLPQEIARIKETQSHSELSRLKSGVVNREMIIAAMEVAGATNEPNTESLEIVFGHTIPNILAITDTSKKGSNPDAVQNTLSLLPYSVNRGFLVVTSPLCPPYHYKEDENGLLSHASGQILPTIGPRFGVAIESLKKTFEPLADSGVDVSIRLKTYTGSTGDVQDLVEIGQDVMGHYINGRSRELFDNLRTAAADANQQMDTILRSTKVRYGITSIEESYGQIVKEAIVGINNNFPHLLEDHHHHSGVNKHVERWLKEKFNMPPGFLDMFVQEEVAYRKKQGSLISSNSEPVILSSTKEAMLYFLIAVDAMAKKEVVIDMETTNNYMLKALQAVPAPVIMAARYNKRDKSSRFNISQPFNPPIQ